MKLTSIPTTLVTGFLGSGKTTLILNLIDQLQNQKEQVIYIKNEIGSEDIDGALVKGKHIQTKELLNGCICCTLVGPFVGAIEEITKTYQPDRIIIEASGAADPTAIALMISSTPGVHRDGVISIIDVVNFEGYKDLSFTAQQQAKFTDLLIFNKVELASLERKRAVVGYVRELNAIAPILEAPHGHISSDVVFGIGSRELNTLLEKSESDPHEHHDHETHLHSDGLSTQTTTPPIDLTETQLRHWLTNLPNAVFRVKGFVKFDSAQPDQVYLVDKVGQRIDIKPAPHGFSVAESKLVLIGFGVDELAESATSFAELPAA